MNQKIIEFVKENSYFTMHDEEVIDGIYEYSTKKHSSIFEEEFGPADLEAAEDLKKQLLENFDDIDVIVDTNDPWVNVTIIERHILNK